MFVIYSFYISTVFCQSLRYFLFKIEVAHQHPHEIIIFHNFVSKNEANQIIDMSLPSIQPAVVGKKIVSILIEFEDDILNCSFLDSDQRNH